MDLTSLKKLKWHAVRDFFIWAVILGILIHCAYLKVDSMLKSSLEEFVALNSRSIAVGLNNQFEEEFKKLKATAYSVENDIIPFEKLESVFSFNNNGEKIGIVTEDNQPILGLPLPQIIEKRFEKVFGGENFVAYQYNVGLIFAVPIKIDNQNCLLYEIIPTNIVKKNFRAVSYNGAGTVILLNSMEDWMIIADGEELINTERGMDKNWAAVTEKMQSNQNDAAWSVYGEFKDKRYFVYLASVSRKYNFAISGYVSWEKAAVGIDYIYRAMLVAFFFIFLCLLLGVRYVMRTRQAKFLEQEKNWRIQPIKPKARFCRI